MRRSRVFVVDDSTASVIAIRLAISRDNALEYVGSAQDAKEALDRCRNVEADVITLDLNMPNDDGLEMLVAIKAACHAPVVVVSASTYEGSPAVAEALIRGADACFDKRQVLSHVDAFLAVLRAAAQIPSSPLETAK